MSFLVQVPRRIVTLTAVAAVVASVLVGVVLSSVTHPSLVRGGGHAALLVPPLQPSAPVIVTRAAGAAKAPNPSSNIAPNPPNPLICSIQPTGSSCEDSAITALNHARSVLGLGPYDLPPSFESLSATAQLVVLSNLDRATYGLPPILGTTAVLNQLANNAIAVDEDPVGLLASNGGLYYTMWTSNWAAGWASALYTYYEWMYDDGLGSTNIDCTSSNPAGCWGHRENTLANFPNTTLVMGVATGTSPHYGPAFTELYESVASGTPSYLPTITGIAQEQASSTVQISGFGLSGANGVKFNGTAVPYSVNSFSSVNAVAPSGASASVVVASPAGSSPPMQSPALVSASAAAPGSYVSVTPSRLLDTRKSKPIARQSKITVPVLGHGGVPSSGVSGVVLNVGAVTPPAPGYLTVWPSGGPKPNTSSVNFSAHVTVPNLVMMPLTASGSVDIANSSGAAVQVIVDVFGYYVDGSGSSAGAFVAVTPARLLDTRTGVGLAPAIPARVAGGGTLTVKVTDTDGVPLAGVAAVVVNVTVTGPVGAGYLTVWADLASRPVTSNLNFAAKQTVPNLVVAPVGADGKIQIYNGSGGTLDVVADVAGYYRSGVSTAGGVLNVVTPTRLLDTRIAVGAPQQTISSGATLRLQVTGRGGVPTANVCAVVLNVTSVRPSAAIYATVWADGKARPTTSNLNVNSGQTVPNLAVAPVGALGVVDLYVSGGSSHLLADVVGYFSCTSGSH